MTMFSKRKLLWQSRVYDQFVEELRDNNGEIHREIELSKESLWKWYQNHPQRKIPYRYTHYGIGIGIRGADLSHKKWSDMEEFKRSVGSYPWWYGFFAMF